MLTVIDMDKRDSEIKILINEIKILINCTDQNMEEILACNNRGQMSGILIKRPE